jgi:carbamoyltransferase
VTKQSSESFYYLLKEFKKITNTPVLINTSFNFAGEPIVETPEDAIKSFLSSKLDYLVINNYLISKEKIFKEFIYKRPLMQIKEITIIS